MADFRLRQLIKQKLESGEPLTPEEEREDALMAAEQEGKPTPSALSKLQEKAAPSLSPAKEKETPSTVSPPKKEEKLVEPPKAPKKDAKADDGYRQASWADHSKTIGALRAEMPATQRKSFDDEYQNIEDMRARAIASYREDRKSADWGRVAEMLARAALKLAAGYSGLKSGVDMTGAVDSGERWDWKTDYDNMKNELNMTLDSAEARRKGTERKEDRIQSELRDTTAAMRKEKGALEEDKRRIDITRLSQRGADDKIAAKEREDQAKEDRFYAAKNLEAVQKELDALTNAKTGLTKKGKLSRAALTTDLAGLGIELGSIPEAKGWLWGTQGEDSVDAAELGKVLAAHEKKLRERQSQLLSPKARSTSEAPPPTPEGVEEERVDKASGKTAIFKDKKFLRWK